MNEYVEKECIICLKKFESKTSPKRKTHRLGIRPAKSLTCSPACTLVYTRIYKIVKLRYKQHMEKKNDE